MARRKVFGIGFGKTGTTTLGECMRCLGYRHLGWTDGLTEAVIQSGPALAIDIAARYDSVDDWPWPMFFRELDEAFPGSRFVLTVRKDSAAWFSSLVAHARRGGASEERRLVLGCDHPEQHKDEVISRYESHNRNVMEYFSKDPKRLLIVCWETGSGWGELCEFLDEEIPPVDLPHTNKRPPETPFNRLRVALWRWKRRVYRLLRVGRRGTVAERLRR